MKFREILRKYVTKSKLISIFHILILVSCAVLCIYSYYNFLVNVKIRFKSFEEYDLYWTEHYGNDKLKLLQNSVFFFGANSVFVALLKWKFEKCWTDVCFHFGQFLMCELFALFLIANFWFMFLEFGNDFPSICSTILWLTFALFPVLRNSVNHLTLFYHMFHGTEYKQLQQMILLRRFQSLIDLIVLIVLSMLVFTSISTFKLSHMERFIPMEYLISWVLGDYYFEEMKSRRIITNIQNLFTKLIICLAYLLQWPILKDAFTLMYYQYMSEEPPKEKSLFSTKKTDLAAVYIFFCRVYSRVHEHGLKSTVKNRVFELQHSRKNDVVCNKAINRIDIDDLW